MIRINLLGEGTVKDPRGILFVAGYGASVAVALLVFFIVQTSVSGQIDEASFQATELEGKLAKLQETTKDVKDLEKKRKELADKLAVIARLRLHKVGPVRVMDDMNSAIPETAWLQSVREKANQLSIEGFALDPQTISLFMTQLEQSDYFKKVDLDETKQASRKGVKIQAFKIKADIDYAGNLAVEALADEGNAKGKDSPPDVPVG